MVVTRRLGWARVSDRRRNLALAPHQVGYDLGRRRRAAEPLVEGADDGVGGDRIARGERIDHPAGRRKVPGDDEPAQRVRRIAGVLREPAAQIGSARSVGRSGDLREQPLRVAFVVAEHRGARERQPQRPDVVETGALGGAQRPVARQPRRQRTGDGEFAVQRARGELHPGGNEDDDRRQRERERAHQRTIPKNASSASSATPTRSSRSANSFRTRPSASGYDRGRHARRRRPPVRPRAGATQRATQRRRKCRERLLERADARLERCTRVSVCVEYRLQARNVGARSPDRRPPPPRHGGSGGTRGARQNPSAVSTAGEPDGEHRQRAGERRDRSPHVRKIGHQRTSGAVAARCRSAISSAA